MSHDGLGSKAQDMTAQEHLKWATGRALEYYDAGDVASAVGSFVSDVQKHEGTSHIFSNPSTITDLSVGVGGGRESFRQAMMGFPVNG